tara:strand:+ start:14 stop:463 length:450 start_codon:yes stop_codon:yes gene_type:complete
MGLVAFLNGEGTDYKGRCLLDIWNFDDNEIEQTHDYIQFMFPLAEKSGSYFNAPILSLEDIKAIRLSEVAQANLKKSAEWYLGFLRRHDHWIKAYDHNHLRITRTIKSLRLLVSQETAEAFLNSVFGIIGDRVNVVRQDAIGFWKSSVN